MFGRDDIKDEETYSEFVMKWKESLQSAIRIASKSSRSGKNSYDKKTQIWANEVAQVNLDLTGKSMFL